VERKVRCHKVHGRGCGKLDDSNPTHAVSMASAYKFDSDIFLNLRRRFLERMPLLAVGEVEIVGMFRLRIEGRFAPLNAPLNMTDGRGPARPDRFVLLLISVHSGFAVPSAAISFSWIANSFWASSLWPDLWRAVPSELWTSGF